MDHGEITLELMTVVTTLLAEVSLLPLGQYLAIAEQAFKRGLGHKPP